MATIFLIHGSYGTPLEKGKELATHLGTELILVRGAGHFNKESGYTKFPLLLKKIE